MGHLTPRMINDSGIELHSPISFVYRDFDSGKLCQLSGDDILDAKILAMEAIGNILYIILDW